MQNYLPKKFKGNDGSEIPSLGMGTAGIKTNDSDVIYNSIKDGLRLIDTASKYGSEEAVGIAIKKAIDEGIVKREDLFITTKISELEIEDPEKAIKSSLKRLGLDYIDLYLDHWPHFLLINDNWEIKYKLPMHEKWKILESFVEKGYTKHIGVSNYNVQSLCNLLSFCKIKPLVNQVEFHPYLYQKNLLNFCNKENIILFGYNPLVKGDYCQEYKDKTNIDLLGESIIKELSKKYNKTPGQIVLNWIVSKGVVPIPKTGNPKRMKENLDSINFNMENEDIIKIDSLNKNFRFGNSYAWDIYNKEIDVFA